MGNYLNERISDWEITSNGSLLHTNGYHIPASRLTEDDWLLHLMEKTWFDANTFLPAWFEALSKRGINEVTIKTNY